MKLIVSDYDDTFSEDLDKNIEFANKFINDGNLFVIATGSSYQSYIDKLGENCFNPSYVIVNHGSLMYDVLIEIISSKASKIKAINKIIKLENLGKVNVYTIDDGYNDIEMIKEFNGFAIKNSVDALKKDSKKQVDSVYELIKEIGSI